ncbi:phage tail protein [Maribellus comscasis]|uniref:Phage tail protein n=1 Tax=Maribellus comscasis TaxID=2681766 RepID=A0A6I6K3P4_9BACT|nr:phage tail protein [Maribellus comscasis]QGY47042.1 phage tail protein [Maribellus comscasis]
MANYYPPVGFHFKVEFANLKSEFEFQSVSGLTIELTTEEIAEGGENRFKHKLPVRTSFPNLVLKRGLVTDSSLIKWCREAVEDFSITPTDVTISLLNEEHKPLMTWNVVHAYPLKWAMADFNAEESKLVVETIELAYNYFKIQ